MITYSGTYKSRNFFQIAGQLKIKNSPTEIWKVLIEDGHLENFHPYCESHKKVKWDGVGCKDEMKFYSGNVVDRIVIAWDEGRSFTIKMNKDNGHNTHVKFEIIPVEEESFFKLTIETNSFRNKPRLIWHLFASLALTPSYKKYLNSICNGLKYYCETAKKVSRNQFGSHKKFSP